MSDSSLGKPSKCSVQVRATGCWISGISYRGGHRQLPLARMRDGGLAGRRIENARLQRMLEFARALLHLARKSRAGAAKVDRGRSVKFLRRLCSRTGVLHVYMHRERVDRVRGGGGEGNKYPVARRRCSPATGGNPRPNSR